MQLLFILGILFAITAITFAMQNDASVAVALGIWHFESSMAVVLLLAIGLGALIAGLVSTPHVIKSQWDKASLRRLVKKLEEDNASLGQKILDLESRIAKPKLAPLPAAEQKSYVGMKALLTGGTEHNS